MVAQTVLQTVKPTPGTPTALFRGRKGKIDGIPVWLKGVSPTGDNDESHSPYHERAAYIINEMLGLGLVPSTILHLVDGEVVSAMKWVRGKRPCQPQPPLLEMFDYLICNTDRHGGNWLVKPSGRVWAIDNAYSFRDYRYADDFDYVELPTKIKQKMQDVAKDPRKFYRQLGGLLDRKQITAVIKRIKVVLKENKKGGG